MTVAAAGSDGGSPLVTWWARLSRVQRGVVAALAFVVALNAGLVGLRSTLGSGPGGPISSSYSTGGAGLEAYADLARASGHEVVRLKQTPDPGELPTDATVVLADPDRVTDDDVEALARFLLGGGRLVVAGEGTGPLLQGATGTAVSWEATAPVDVLEVDPSGGPADGGVPLGSVRRVDGDAGGRWVDIEGLDVLVADDRGRAVVVSAPAGDGTVIALADTDPLHNSNLASADNAALALELIGGPGRSVVFFESVHGFGATGVDALPSSWKWAAAGLALSLLVGMWWAGSRFGPPEPSARALRPARLEHVRAVAADLERVSSAPADLVGPLLDANRAELAERLQVEAGSSEAVWRRAAEAAGLDPAVVEAGTTVPADLEGALYVGALAAHHRSIAAEPSEPLSPTNRPGTVAGPDAP